MKRKKKGSMNQGNGLNISMRAFRALASKNVFLSFGCAVHSLNLSFEFMLFSVDMKCIYLAFLLPQM